MTTNEYNSSERQNSGSSATNRRIDTAELTTIDEPAVDIFALYTSRHRREAIRFLAEDLADDNAIRPGELATHLTAQLEGTKPRNVSSDNRKSVYVGLSQMHLEKLEATNVITHADAGMTTTEITDTVAALMQLVETACGEGAPSQDGDTA
jgi:hypothetical protein